MAKTSGGLADIDLANSKGMVMDGIAASQAIDTAGERLDVAGCDISSLPVDGSINIEHRSADKSENDDDDEKAVLGEETIGRILYAHKVMDADDCVDARQRMYWDEIGLPFVYIIYRLYDGAGHRAAQAYAAQIRDAHAHGEKILVRLSIEGATLRREGNVLKESVARKVSATIKPCNRTCDVGMLADPNAPDGFEKLADIEKAEPEHVDPTAMRLGGHETEWVPFAHDEESSFDAKVRVLVKMELVKALVAGGYGCAPGSLVGGAALGKESLQSRMKRAITTYKAEPFDKTEFKAFAKTHLPEASDDFIDHFADVAEDYHVKRMRKAEGEGGDMQYLNPEGNAHAQEIGGVPGAAFRKDEEHQPGIDLEGDREVQPQPDLKWAAPTPEPAKPEQPKSWVKGPGPRPSAKGATVGSEAKNRLSLDERGNLHMPKGGVLEFHAPSGPEYLSILHPDVYDIPEERRRNYKETVHQPWERAMESWMELNKRAREGRTPRSVVKLAGLFAAQSPNTGVALQERHYGHVMDMLHEGTMRLDEPITQAHIQDFERRAQGPNLPVWNREHYEVAGPDPGVSTEEEAAERAAEENRFGNAKAELPQINGLRHLDELMPHLETLFAEGKDDGRAMATKLMAMKSAYKRLTTQNVGGKRLGAAGAKQALQGDHPIVAGFGPKLTRYMLAMAGAGNIIVPDRHMTRSLFNLPAADPISDYLGTQVVTKPSNEPVLAQLDQHFFHRHPAVRYVLQRYPEHFKGHEEQAIFPAFWLHWLHIPHYERNQGRSTEATISGTDHRVFWDSVQDSMRRHGIPVRGQPFRYTPLDTSFDFGDLGKAEQRTDDGCGDLPLEVRAMAALGEVQMRYGESGALAAYYAHVVPHLLAQDEGHQSHDPYVAIRKAEAAAIALRQRVDEVLGKSEIASGQRPRTVWFAGAHVQPGHARTADGDYDLLHEDGAHFYAVPAGTPQHEYPDALVRLPLDKWGTHYSVDALPVVARKDLE